MSEREHAAAPHCQCGFDRAVVEDPVAPQRPHRRSLRSPELQRRPRTGISLKRNPAPPATSPSCGQQPLHHPGGPSRSNCAAPDSSATTRQGIKNTTISPAGNVGERARRSPPLSVRFRSGCCRRPRSSTAAAPSVAPIARAPASAPNRNITEKESGAAGDLTIVRPAAAAPPRRPEQVELRRAGFFGDHPPRDKEHHHLASRKCRRESTPQPPTVSAVSIGLLSKTP